MDDKSPVSDAEKTADSISITRQPAQPHSESKTHVANIDIENGASASSREHNIPLTDVVDWESEDDPSKPMNW
jgi:hypothetical protein